MNGDQLLQLARVYQENYAFITNEETAKMSLVVPFIRLLGYDTNLPREVRLEYTAEFTQGDGKRLPDRMDFVIFDKTGVKPLIVIETKPIGTNLPAKSQQLSRYISQLPDLHFGIITDGCEYLFYGDLENSNVMDMKPFFSFSLKNSNVDWGNVAAFLSKFSREAFNADGLVTDAENSRYRQAMVEKIVGVLRAPSKNEQFMKWLTNDIYNKKRTEIIMERMGTLADEAIEPAVNLYVDEEFIERLTERMRAAKKLEDEKGSQSTSERKVKVHSSDNGTNNVDKKAGLTEIVTTEEELRFHQVVKEMVGRAGKDVDKVLGRDTVNYYNVSFDKPTKWFVRFFANSKKVNISTLVTTDRSRELAPAFEVEDAPGNFGVSRIYMTDIKQLTELEPVIIESLNLLLEK